MASESDRAAPHPDTELADETAERILDAAWGLFLEFGFRRTTMEDVAKRIGVSRVTVYRYHADKAALFQTVILREVQRAAADIEARLAALSNEENPVVEGFTMAVLLARQHPLVRRLLATEPEWMLLHLTLKAGTGMQWAIAAATAFLRQPRFAGFLADGDLDLAGELFVRLLQSAMLTPGGILGSDEEDDLRRVARYVVEPLLRPKAQ